MLVSDCPGGLQDGPVGDIQCFLSVLQRKKCCSITFPEPKKSTLFCGLQPSLSPAICFATTRKPTANSDSTDLAQRIIFRLQFSNITERQIRFGDSFNVYHIDKRDPLHRKIWQRVSFRPHPRNGLQCATTLRGGCTPFKRSKNSSTILLRSMET